MFRTSTLLIFTLLLVSGCSSTPLNEAGEALVIKKIHIDPTSKHSDGSTEMINRCSGFILSETEVRDFLTYASRIKNEGPGKYYLKLPCSATGSAVINGKKYNWVVRAGGVGELESGTEKLIAVCGKKCCGKVPGVC